MAPKANRPFDLLAFLLAALLCLVPCAYYFECTSWQALARPWYALQDVPLMCGYYQAFAEGEGFPFVPHFVSRLNAPYTANWADFPTTEELIWAFGGTLTYFLGAIRAYNLSILCAHVLAGASMYLCARWSGTHRAPAVLAAFAFSTCRFLFVRDSMHINLSYCWHLPAMWVACRYLWEGKPLQRKHWLAMTLLCWLTAWQHPYFWYGWLVMLVPCWLQPLLLKNFRKAMPALALSATSVGFLLLSHFDTLLSWAIRGRSAQTFTRTINELQIYGLRLPDLFLPYQHHFRPWDEWAQQHYYQGMLRTGYEMDSHYFGLLALLGLAHLTWLGLSALARSRPVPFAFGMSLWLIAVGICGGLNMCAGTLGLLLFRCSCRFSVLILAGVLLHIAEWFTQTGWLRGKRLLWLFLIIPLSCLDTMPPRPVGKDFIWDTITNQRALVGYLEKSLPPRAQVFQWPVMDYPEGQKLNKLEPYEQMYAYLLSKDLRFSFGDCRGRPESQWQHGLSPDDKDALMKQLESYGFEAFVLYRAGLANPELAGWDTWKRKPDFVSPWNDLWVYRLHPSGVAQKPPLLPSVSFGSSFFPEDHDQRMRWRWAFGPSEMELIVPSPCPYRFQFGISAMGSPTDYRLWLDGRWLCQVEAPAQYALYRQLTVDLSKLKPGIHKIRIQPQGGLPARLEDGARLSFQLINPEFVKP